MAQKHKVRRSIVAALALVIAGILMATNQESYVMLPEVSSDSTVTQGDAAAALATLEVKGRASKTGYTRDAFGNGWAESGGCDMRNIILHRDLTDVVVTSDCHVLSGLLNDPYTGKMIDFRRGAGTSNAVQVDHVVALSDAWQKGASYWTDEQRAALANDPLELLAVDGPANQQKSDGDAATWLPGNKPFRCQYVARQIAVKQKYHIWVTQAEHDVMATILARCPGQALPSA